MQVTIFHEREDHHGLGDLQGAQLDAHTWKTQTVCTAPWAEAPQCPTDTWDLSSPVPLPSPAGGRAVAART